MVLLAPTALEMPRGLRNNGWPGVLATSTAYEKSEILSKSSDRFREMGLFCGDASSL